MVESFFELFCNALENSVKYRKNIQNRRICEVKEMKWKQLEAWQKKKVAGWLTFYVIVATLFIGFVVVHMRAERNATADEYEAALANDENSAALEKKYSESAVKVSTGTYVESIKDISLKNCNYRVVFIIWFKWNDAELDFLKDQFRVYNGVINKKEVIKDYHENGVNYQEFRLDVTVSKSFNITRFPLGSQVLKFYVEPNGYTADEMVFVPDTENSGVNKNLSISGYELVRHDVAEHTIAYPNTMNNPRFDGPRVTSEIVTVMEVQRSDWGLYLKCFIALVGTTTWMFIVLYVSAFHKVNPLGTIPAALFGTIGNLMVGANLLPDVVQMGLVEFVNFYGTLIILAGALVIININRIREHHGNNKFAKYFGKVMFFTLLILCLAGQIIMPISANMWGR